MARRRRNERFRALVLFSVAFFSFLFCIVQGEILFFVFERESHFFQNETRRERRGVFFFFLNCDGCVFHQETSWPCLDCFFPSATSCNLPRKQCFCIISTKNRQTIEYVHVRAFITKDERLKHEKGDKLITMLTFSKKKKKHRRKSTTKKKQPLLCLL